MILKKATLVFLLMIICSYTGYSQRIEEHKVFGGYRYLQGGERLNLRELAIVVDSIPESASLIREARTIYALAVVTGGIGGGLIGYQTGTYSGGGDPNWIFAGVGAGLVLLGIPLTSLTNSKTRQAVALYNLALGETSFREKIDFGLVANSSGVGLMLTF